jgi:hypothetical protein
LIQANELDEQLATAFSSSSLHGTGRTKEKRGNKSNNSNGAEDEPLVIHYFGSWFLDVVVAMMTRYLWIGFPLDLYQPHEFTIIYWYVCMQQCYVIIIIVGWPHWFFL